MGKSEWDVLLKEEIGLHDELFNRYTGLHYEMRQWSQ
jgi:hypothetical protein